MDLPKGSADLDDAKERLHKTFADDEKAFIAIIDDIAKSGWADKRWCSIARTHFEEGFLAIHRSLRDYPGDDPNEYGKVATHQPMPRGFTPDVDTKTNIAPPHTQLPPMPPNSTNPDDKSG